MRNIIIFAAALMALSILPVNAKAANLEMDEKKTRIIITEEDEKSPTRSPIVYDVDMTVESVNNTLCIMFTGYLPDANIIVTDAYGNIVIQQTLVTISTGTTFYVTPDDSYPYDIVITSPATGGLQSQSMERCLAPRSINT